MGCGCGKKFRKSDLLGGTGLSAQFADLNRVNLADAPNLANLFNGEQKAQEPGVKPSDTE